MFDKERVLQLLREKGPIIPVQISKEINQNILMTSAILSEMASRKEIKVSNIKIGGSPLYYLDGQEAKLQEYSVRLAPKEKEAYEFLKQSKVLAESKLDPAIKSAIKTMKDFAVPLKVTFNGEIEIFWKWYLYSNQDAEDMIKKLLGVDEQKQLKESRKELVRESAPIDVATKDQLKEELSQLSPKEPEKKIVGPMEPQIVKEERKEKKPREKKVKEAKKEISDDAFIDHVDKFFTDNSIKVLHKDFVKKGESDYVIRIPTSIGEIDYFVKAKAKKKITEPDLSSSVIQGAERNLPVFFITNGAVANNIQDMLTTRFRRMLFKKLE